MYKCARCDDFLIGHTCHSCHLRHRCLDPKCDCQKYPLLPLAFGNSHQGFSSGAKSTWNPKKYLEKRINRSIGGRRLSIAKDGY